MHARHRERGFRLNSSIASIGAALKDARETANASIEEVAWRTRIRPEYLRALEDGRYEDLGDFSFVRGHLHSYARTLGLDPAAVIAAYEREFVTETPSPIRHLDETVGVGKKPPRARWRLAALVTGAVLAAVSAVGLLHGPGEPLHGDVSLPDLPAPNAAPKVAGAGAAREPAPQAGPARTAVGGTFAVGLSITDRCWVEVVADGKTVFSGIIDAGAERSFTATTTLKLTLGNAGAARVRFNGAAVTAGASGVWQGTFGPRGLQA